MNNKNVSFCSQEIQPADTEKELKKKLDCSEASQDSDLPTTIIKENIDIFVPAQLTEFHESTFYEINKHNTSI